MARADQRNGAPPPTRRATCATACRNPAAARPPPTLRIAAIREHLAAKGLGLHNDLQDESSIVGNFPIIPALADYGTREAEDLYRGHHHRKETSFLRPDRTRHGSDATWLGDGKACVTAIIGSSTVASAGTARWPAPTPILVFARTSGKPGEAKGITAFIVPTDTPGHNVL